MSAAATTTPSPAALRAARTIKHFEGIVGLYGYTLSARAVAAIIDREVHADTVNVTPPPTADLVTVYPSTVRRHREGVLGTANRLLSLTG